MRAARRVGAVGVLVLGAVAILNVLLWIIARPNGEPTGRYIGEICGAEAVLPLSCTLVLATLLGAHQWASAPIF